MTKRHVVRKTALTAASVKRIKPPRSGRKDHFDAALPSFCLRVSYSGRKTYALFYRPKSGPNRGKLKRFTIGSTAEYTLAEAREKARIMKQQVDAGGDPALLLEETHAEAMRRAHNTVGRLVDDFIEKYAKRQTKSWRQARGVFVRHVLPSWRDRPIESIARRDVIELLDGLVEKDMPAMANRTLAHVRKFLNWCVERSVLEANPAALVKPPGGKERPRDRELSDDEIKVLWPIFDQLSYPFGAMFQLMLTTAQRRNEVATLRQEDLNLEGRVWHMPREFTKAGRSHSVPLSLLAVQIIQTLPRFEGPYLFTTASGEKPVSGYSRAKLRVEKRVNATRAAEGLQPLPNWRLHDLRRTAATGMARLGIPPDHISRVLNHSPVGVTASVYDKHTYLPEKKRALDIWAAHLEQLLSPQGDNVVSLETRR